MDSTEKSPASGQVSDDAALSSGNDGHGLILLLLDIVQARLWTTLRQPLVANGLGSVKSELSYEL